MTVKELRNLCDDEIEKGNASLEVFRNADEDGLVLSPIEKGFTVAKKVAFDAEGKPVEVDDPEVMLILE